MTEDARGHEPWLVAQIEERFAAYAVAPTPRIIDELYVLIGTLKIVGLDSAYEAMREVLTRVSKPVAASAESGKRDARNETELSERTARFLRRVEPATSRLRVAESAQIAAQMLRPHAPIVAIVGEAGVGRTALLHEVAAQLAATDNAMNVWRMSPESTIANPGASLRMALEDLKSDGVIVIDDVDELADLGTQDPDRAFLEAISDARLHPRARVLLVVNSRRLSRIGILNQALDEWMIQITLDSLAPSELVSVVSEVAAANVARAGLTLADRVVAAALAPAEIAGASVHPGLAIDRIDQAIGRALLEKSKTVDVEHVPQPAGPRSVAAEANDLVDHLRAHVRGQDHAITAVASRLALTRAGLDLRPQRPNGVFLFAGPTGVGKTELATQIAIAEYGSADGLIRLDMSEYGTYEFGLTRLIGVGQGYVGQNDPDGWLTTRVARRPRSVILLDEIEKAHPSVWNTFLQVFDAGRLTDGRGVTASFADTVVIMTSNIGVRESTKKSIGFGTGEGSQGGARQLAAIKESIAPELINRLDEIVLFNPLSMDAIVEIAGLELAATQSRLGSAGWQIEYDDDVPRWLATTGYDPAYGARHLLRNIEREFLGKLATADSRAVRVDADSNGISVRPLGEGRRTSA